MNEFVFPMPDIGEGIVDAEIVKWHVSVGDRIAEDDPLVDVLTDKATVEITSPVSGRVRKLGATAGDRLAIGAVCVVLETTEGGEPAASTAVDKPRLRADVAEVPHSPAVAGQGSGASPPVAAALTQPAADLTGSDAPGAEVRPASTPPATPLPVSSALTSESSSGTPEIGSSASDSPTESSMNPVDSARADAVRVLASPAVRRLAHELGVDLSGVAASGDRGQVTRADLLQQVRRGLEPAETNAATVVDAARIDSAASGGQSQPPKAIEPEYEIRPVTGLRRVIADKLQASKRHIPHFTYVEEIDITELEKLRRHLNSRLEEDAARLSLLHFIVYALAVEITAWPQCNAHFDDEQQQLKTFSVVHAGIATMTDDGLVVPVLQNAQSLSVQQIANEVAALAHAARDRRLSPEKLTGSTVTITSLGPLAGIATTPIINRPETCIVGPNKMRDVVVMQHGSPVVRQVMNLSASFDHRIVDGYDAAQLIQALKRRLEYPATMFMG